MNIRIKFEKSGAMKFVGHLDMMRYFQRCIRRAGIDIAYSEGFSPHQIMSFASPLGVGITSSGEYLDIKVHSSKSSEESIHALNEVMAEGVRVVSYRRLEDGAKNAMSLTAAADYEIRFKDGYEMIDVDFEASFNRYFKQPKEILIEKRTKKGTKTIDLKKLIYDFRIFMENQPSAENKRPVFYLKVSAGSVENLKPQLVLSSFYEFLGHDFDPLSVSIHRLDVYGETGGVLVSLGEMGETIEYIK